MAWKKEVSRFSFYEEIASNKRKSFLLTVTIFVILILLGYVISLLFDPSLFFFIMIIVIIISTVYTIVGYYKSDKIALASVKAKPAPNSGVFRQYHNSVEGLALASGIPKPKLYIMGGEQINAFATGRNPQNSAICITEGAAKNLNKQELEGVLAHEMSHIANYDIRFMTLTAVMIGMIAIISEIFLRSLWFSGGNRDNNGKSGIILLIIGIALAILAPILTRMVGLAISRKREYSADATAVKFVRSPTGLKNALKKISHENKPKPHDKNNVKSSKALAPLFISDPFKRNIQNLFSTHPPINKRIAILERM